MTREVIDSDRGPGDGCPGETVTSVRARSYRHVFDRDRPPCNETRGADEAYRVPRAGRSALGQHRCGAVVKVGSVPDVARPVALLSSGLLAGAFGYGAVNVVYAFHAVSPEVRFTFHTALMSVNGFVMQAMMALTILSCVVLAFTTRAGERRLAWAATALAVATLLITRFGNVPINQEIKIWAVSGPPAGYADTLSRWENFHFARVACAVAVFVLVVAAALFARRRCDDSD